MNVPRELFVALPATLAACHQTTALPDPPPTGAPSPAADTAALCRGVADANSHVLAKAARSCAAATDPAGGDKRLAEIAETPAFHYCHPSGNGVWVVQLTDATLQAPA